jgi:hypothetical protein
MAKSIIPRVPDQDNTNRDEFTVTSRAYPDDALRLNNSIVDKSKYDFTYFTFPTDIHQDYVGHYMVININVPVNTIPTNFGYDPVVRGRFVDPSQVNMSELSTVDRLRAEGPISLLNTQQRIAGTLSKMSSGFLGTNSSGEDVTRVIGRGTRRLKSAIALHMPSAVVYAENHDFEEVKLTNMILNGVGAGIGGIASFGKSARTGAMQDGVASGGFLGQLWNAITGETAGTVAASLGYPINPRVEVLYSNTRLRQFVMEVLLAPRNEEESRAVASIVRTLRFHAAPELDNGGFTFIPPAEFDITFYHKGQENTALPKINTCVCTRVEVDYASTGVYSTFSNGYPVVTKLSLGFVEVEIQHKKRIYAGY